MKDARYIHSAELPPTEAENRLLSAILGKLSENMLLECFYWKIFVTFVLGCRIDSLVLVAFRLLFCEVKRPKFIKQINNRHIKCSRHLAWVCLDLYGYLVVPSSQKAVPTFLLFIKLNGCHLLANLMFNLIMRNYDLE